MVNNIGSEMLLRLRGTRQVPCLVHINADHHLHVICYQRTIELLIIVLTVHVATMSNNVPERRALHLGLLIQT